MEQATPPGDLTSTHVGSGGFTISGRTATTVWSAASPRPSSAALSFGSQPAGDHSRYIVAQERGWKLVYAASIGSTATGRLGVIDLDDPRTTVTGEATTSSQLWSH
ncbi:MAG: hypothetical protein V9G19_15920 [Tetrasphaera sp.]